MRASFVLSKSRQPPRHRKKRDAPALSRASQAREKQTGRSRSATGIFFEAKSLAKKRSRVRKGDKRERDQQNANDRGQSRGPFVLKASQFKRPGNQPIDQRRFPKIRFAADLWHEPVAGLQHRNSRQNAPAFLALDCE